MSCITETKYKQIKALSYSRENQEIQNDAISGEKKFGK